MTSRDDSSGFAVPLFAAKLGKQLTILGVDALGDQRFTRRLGASAMFGGIFANHCSDVSAPVLIGHVGLLPNKESILESQYSDVPWIAK